MADIKGPVLVKPLPLLDMHADTPFAINLSDYISSPDGGIVKFYCEDAVTTGTLPDGLICTEDGLLGGIPKTETVGNYSYVIIAENDSKDSLVVPLELKVTPKNAADDPDFLANIKPQVWDALGKDLPTPSLQDILTRPITATEIYYLLQRFASLTIWDVSNLNTPAEKTLIALPEANKYYNIFDMGSCLVGAPKDLFTHERTLADALQTAQVMAREAHKRFHTIEFSGFNKMISAAYVEMQVLTNTTGKQLNILHYTPKPLELDMVAVKTQAIRPSI
jgi:hypothetical protein